MCNQPNSPICDKWRELGGFSGPGQTVAGPFLVMNGDATAQVFEHSVIVYTRDHHAFVISHETFDVWRSMSGEPAPDDEPFPDNQQYIGAPTADEVRLSPDGTTTSFERGTLVCYTEESTRRQAVVHGRMNVLYVQLGGVESQLGLPMSSDIETVHLAGHRAAIVQRFKSGSIWRRIAPDVQDPVALWGLIADRYDQLSISDRSVLGFPLTLPEPVLDGPHGQPIPNNASARFEGGAMYSHFQLGASVVRNELLDAYIRSDGPLGDLGYPVADTRPTPSSGGFFNDFQGGVLVWHDPAGPPSPELAGAIAVTKIEAFVKTFRILDGDGLLNEEVEIFVNFKLFLGDKEVAGGRLPPRGREFANDEDVDTEFGFHAPNEHVTGDFSVRLHFEGHDNDLFFDDDAGTIDIVASVDNAWLLRAGLVRYHDRQFEADCIFRNASEPVDQSLWDRRRHFWCFTNFNTEKLSARQYDATFADIHENLPALEKIAIKAFNPVDAGWEELYYHLVYKGIAKEGNCFAMCAESVYAEVDRSPFGEPIYLHPRGLPGLIDQLNIKMGYQAGDTLIDYFIEQFVSGNTHDPVGAFAKSSREWTEQDWPLIAVTPGTFKIAGHVVRPYQWEATVDDDGTLTELMIRVANPNNPAPPGEPLLPPERQGETTRTREDLADECRIVIDPKENEFRITVGTPADEPVWTGGALVFEGGRMYTIPYSKFATQPSTPGFELASGIRRGGMVIFGSAGETHQIADDEGRTFYRPDLAGPPTAWDHIRQDEGGIPGLHRVPVFDGDGRPPELYRIDGRHTFEHRLSARPTSGEEPYVWALRGANITATVALDAAPGRIDSVKSRGVGTRSPAVAVKPASDGPRRNVALRLAGFRGKALTDSHWFGIDELTLPPGHEFGMGMNDACRELLLENKGAERVSCRVSTRNGAERRVEIEGGKSLWIRPNWDHLDLPWRIEVKTPSLRRFLERQALPPRDGIRKHFPRHDSVRSLLALHDA